MNELVIPPQVEEAKAAIAPVVARANALVVTNVEEHTTAMQMLGEVMAADRKVKAIFAPAIEAAMESKRKAERARAEIVQLRDNVLASVTQAIETIGRACKDFEAEERRVARLNQERINAEAAAKQEEQRLLEAAMADTPEEADAIMDEPIRPVRTPTVTPELAKVPGITSRELWSYEITNKAEFLAWASEPANNFYATENPVALNSRARAEKDKLNIPGVKAVSKISHAAR